MEIRIISTEIIKPSSPTPDHLKTYNFSMTDQSLQYVYFPLIFFYSEAEKNAVNISGQLKKSLSEILVHYYPLAGRVKNNYSIDCDDNGVLFIEALIASEMSEVLKSPEINILEQLVPYNNLCEQVNLAIQLNLFGCGGVAICAYFGHVVADATTAAYFVKNWATVARGSIDIECVTFDCTSIFPPRDFMTSLSWSESPTEYVTKRFTFDGSKIAFLREKISETGSCLYHATRFEAVSAVIWNALIAMARNSNEPAPPAMIAVNIRNRINPPLPPHCTGNLLLPITTKVLDHEGTDDYNSLARNIHKSVKMVNGDYASKVKEDDGFANEIIKVFEGFGNIDEMFGFSSWARMPFYEADFGWGKPTWVTTAMSCKNFAVFFDTCDGRGLEVWIGLSKKNMAKFEKDGGILTYASCVPSI